MKITPSSALLWISISFLLFSGCKDDENAVTPADRLAGTWTLQSTEVGVTINNQDYVTYIQQIPGLSEDDKALLIALIQASLQQQVEGITQGTVFEFNADNTYTIKAPGENPENGTWMLNEAGTMLTIDGGTQDEIIFEVESLTDTSLILSFESVGEDDVDDDGEVDIIIGKITLNLSR